jgi:hypothetical protein
MRCEDYPCCGHTDGDPCPDRDASGQIVARCCFCNRRLPRGARSSICLPCQRKARRYESETGQDYFDRED